MFDTCEHDKVVTNIPIPEEFLAEYSSFFGGSRDPNNFNFLNDLNFYFKTSIWKLKMGDPVIEEKPSGMKTLHHYFSKKNSSVKSDKVTDYGLKISKKHSKSPDKKNAEVKNSSTYQKIENQVHEDESTCMSQDIFDNEGLNDNEIDGDTIPSTQVSGSLTCKLNNSNLVGSGSVSGKSTSVKNSDPVESSSTDSECDRTIVGSRKQEIADASKRKSSDGIGSESSDKKRKRGSSDSSSCKLNDFKSTKRSKTGFNSGDSGINMKSNDSPSDSDSGEEVRSKTSNNLIKYPSVNRRNSEATSSDKSDREMSSGANLSRTGAALQKHTSSSSSDSDSDVSRKRDKKIELPGKRTADFSIKKNESSCSSSDSEDSRSSQDVPSERTSSKLSSCGLNGARGTLSSKLAVGQVSKSSSSESSSEDEQSSHKNNKHLAQSDKMKKSSSNYEVRSKERQATAIIATERKATIRNSKSSSSDSDSDDGKQSSKIVGNTISSRVDANRKAKNTVVSKSKPSSRDSSSGDERSAVVNSRKFESTSYNDSSSDDNGSNREKIDKSEPLNVAVSLNNKVQSGDTKKHKDSDTSSDEDDFNEYSWKNKNVGKMLKSKNTPGSNRNMLSCSMNYNSSQVNSSASEESDQKKKPVKGKKVRRGRNSSDTSDSGDERKSAIMRETGSGEMMKTSQVRAKSDDSSSDDENTDELKVMKQAKGKLEVKGNDVASQDYNFEPSTRFSPRASSSFLFGTPDFALSKKNLLKMAMKQSGTVKTPKIHDQKKFNSDLSSTDSDLKKDKRFNSKMKQDDVEFRIKRKHSVSNSSDESDQSKNKHSKSPNKHRTEMEYITSSGDARKSSKISEKAKLKSSKLDLTTSFPHDDKNIVKLNFADMPQIQDELCLEDISSEDEIYILQCPKKLNVASLVGKKLSLSGESVLEGSLKNGKNLPLETFPLLAPSNINVLAPSRQTSACKLGGYRVAGSIIVSERCQVPQVDEITFSTSSRGSSDDEVARPGVTVTPLPLGLKKRHPLLGLNYKNVPIPDFNAVLSMEKKKKKKKKQHDKDIISSLMAERVSSLECDSGAGSLHAVDGFKKPRVPSSKSIQNHLHGDSKSKKSHHRQVDETSGVVIGRNLISLVSDDESSSSKHKKKKKNSRQDLMDKLLENEMKMQEQSSSSRSKSHLNTDIESTKKKKKKMKQDGDLLKNDSSGSKARCTDESSSELSDSSVKKKKKKKKKKHDRDISEYKTDSVSDLVAKLLEREKRLHGQSESYDSSKRDKKKRNKDKRNEENSHSESLTSEEIFSEKKKKKKHKD